ncbi:MAG: hypothetical protein R3F55_16655 [Alphaproteobacteria bacterium]
MQIDGGALFTLEPGEVLTIRANVPAGTNVTITTPAGSVNYDNSGGGAAVDFQQSIAVGDSGGAVVGAITVSGNAAVGGQTITITFNCGAGGLDNAQQAADQIQNVIQSIVPGGANGGDLIADFAIPFESPLNRIGIHAPSFRGDPCIEEIRRLEQAIRAAQAARETAIDRVSNAEDALLRAIDAKVAAEAEARSAASSLLTETPIRSAFDDQSDQDAAIITARDALPPEAQVRQAAVDADAAQARQRGLGGRADPAGAYETAAEQIQAQIDQLDAQLEAAFARPGVEDAFAGDHDGSIQIAAADGTATDIGLLRVTLDDSSAGGRIAGSFNLLAMRQQAQAAGDTLPGLLGDQKFNAWVSGGITLHRDNREGLARTAKP